MTPQRINQQYLARTLSLPAYVEQNGHVAYRLEAAKLVQSILQVLTLWRRDKGKPVVRRGRKATDLLMRAAGLPKGV